MKNLNLIKKKLDKAVKTLNEKDEQIEKLKAEIAKRDVEAELSWLGQFYNK